MDLLRKNSEKYSALLEKIEIKELQNGPPSNSDINVNIKGEDFGTMNRIAEEYTAYLGKIEGIENVKNNYESTKREMKIYVDQEMAMRTGISVLDVATTVRSCYEGSIATKIRFAEEEVDVRVILPEDARLSLDKLRDIKIANHRGGLIPLIHVARFEETQTTAVIGRSTWRRTIAVTADINEKAKKLSSVKVNQALMKQFQDIEKRYPGYEVNYKGEFEDTMESFEELGRSYFIAMLIIYIILVALFKNLRQPLVVMSIVPFSMCGVIYSFFIHGLPLSFMALMGIVGLGGVVVNDSIVLVDFINNARKTGKDVYQATLEAGFKRLRPILLTSSTTILGILPTAYGIGGFDPFLKPMAVAMAYGLLFGTMITLFVTPRVYNIVYSGECREGYNKGVCIEDFIAEEMTESTAAAALYPVQDTQATAKRTSRRVKKQD